MKNLVAISHPHPDFPSWFWFVGGPLQQLLGRLDGHQRFGNWASAVAWATAHCEESGLASLQLWCHGSPGQPYMGEQSFNDFLRDDHALATKLLDSFTDALSPKSLVWFRGCAVFHGVRGVEFAKNIADILDCRVAGHTHNIGHFGLHSGLHSVEPGCAPSWSYTEGQKRGGGILSSYPSAPNTITALRNSIPEGW